METKEIKLNEPFTLEGKMVKIVECDGAEKAFQYIKDTPQKERWFKCLDNFHKEFIKGVLYKRPYGHQDGSIMSKGKSYVWLDWEVFDKNFQEINPDFICQHSGEAFMFGDTSYITYPEQIYPDQKLPVHKSTIEYEEKRLCKGLAHFHSESDALAWQEKKFGKKEERPEKIFTVPQVREFLHDFMNDKITFSRFVELLNEVSTDYILNKKGGNR
jgi:hypothetical protein